MDAVVWQDADSVWWAALDLSELRGPADGALADFMPMTDFKAKRQVCRLRGNQTLAPG